MAFNPSPKVAAARDIGKQFGMDIVIVLMIDTKTGAMSYASYGKDTVLCAAAKELADIAYEAIETRRGL